MTVPLCRDRKSTRLNSSHTVIYTLSLHDALPIYYLACCLVIVEVADFPVFVKFQFIKGVAQDDSAALSRSEEHTSELQSHSDLHSFPTRRSSDLLPRVLPRDRRGG